MKKATKIIITIVVIIAIALATAGIFILTNTKTSTKLGAINSAEDLSTLVDKIYDGQAIRLPSLQTQIIDTTDDSWVQYTTGLENAKDIEYIVESEPMMTSQAYSLVLVKVKDGANADEIAKSMNEKINSRKWICVSAEKVYTTSSGNVVCLVMSSEANAKPIYEKFKELAGNIGKEYEKSEEEVELPPEMF